MQRLDLVRCWDHRHRLLNRTRWPGAGGVTVAVSVWDVPTGFVSVIGVTTNDGGVCAIARPGSITSANASATTPRAMTPGIRA